MAEEVGFEPTLLRNKNVNDFRFIGKMTLFRPVKVHIAAPAVDHDFGGFLFKNSSAHGDVCELSACFAFKFRLLGDFHVGQPAVFFQFGGVDNGDILEECAPGFF
jgi:hypothetical protein